MSAQRDPNRKSLHSHYVSNANGVIYAAQTGLPGIEDDNPIDWRPATHEEIAQYESGDRRAAPPVRGAVDLTAADPKVSPSSLTLADDGVAAPAGAAELPPLPPGALDIAPAPAFTLPSE